MPDPGALRRQYGLSAGWRYSSGAGHFAWDIPCPDGTEIMAGCTGTVRAVNDGVPDNKPGHDPGSGAPSNWVLVWTQCEGRAATVYYQHLSAGVPVHAGQAVAPSTVIGYSGNSGHSTGPHLHCSTQWGHTDRRYDPDGTNTIWEPWRVFTTPETDERPDMTPEQAESLAECRRMLAVLLAVQSPLGNERGIAAQARADEIAENSFEARRLAAVLLDASPPLGNERTLPAQLDSGS